MTEHDLVMYVLFPGITILGGSLLSMMVLILKKIYSRIDTLSNELTGVRVSLAGMLKASTVREIVDDKINPIKIKCDSLDDKINIALGIRPRKGPAT